MHKLTNDLIAELRTPLKSCCPDATGEAFNVFIELIDDARVESAAIRKKMRAIGRVEDRVIFAAWNELREKLSSLDYHVKTLEDAANLMQEILVEIKRETPRILDYVEAQAAALDEPVDAGAGRDEPPQ